MRKHTRATLNHKMPRLTSNWKKIMQTHNNKLRTMLLLTVLFPPVLASCSTKPLDVGLAVPVTCPAKATPPAVVQAQPHPANFQVRFNGLLTELQNSLSNPMEPPK